MTLDVHTKKIIEAIATVAHVGQYDLGDKDQPHIKHVRMVASNFEGVRPANAFWLEEDQDELWGLSMLHDVYEDSGVTPGTLTRLGVPQRIAMGVDLLSRRIITEAGEKEHYDEYIERLLGLPPLCRSRNPRQDLRPHPQHEQVAVPGSLSLSSVRQGDGDDCRAHLRRDRPVSPRPPSGHCLN
jgi:hypothetical protein